MDPEPTQTVVLRDFELRPSYLKVVEGTVLKLKIGSNSRGYSQVYADARQFIFSIDELDVETPPLHDSEQFQFPLERKGSYVLRCQSYCKISMKIQVVEDTSSSEASRKRSSRSASIRSVPNDPQLEGALLPSETHSFDKYEDFAGLISSNFSRSDKIPSYLLDCFKHQLNLLESLKDLEESGVGKSQELEKSPIEELRHQCVTEEDKVDEATFDEMGDDMKLEESRKCHTQGSIHSQIMEEESCEESSKGSLESPDPSIREPSRNFMEEKARFLRGKRYFPEKKNPKQEYYSKLLSALHNSKSTIKAGYTLATYFQ